MSRKISADRYSVLLFLLTFAALLLAASPAIMGQKDESVGSMPGMDMSKPGMEMSKEEMRKMGPSMAAMAGHMIVTSKWPEQPGDEERAMAVIAAAKATMERYIDYHNALADGYYLLHPDAQQTQWHFPNDANGNAADVKFDPTKPSALLYLKGGHYGYKLEGVMYTARVHESEEELNKRIPLSIARWHQHVNFCAAPADRVKEYFGPHPTFGMFGSINTKAACDAAGGTFYPFMFSWMIHVFPYEKDFKGIFSMNDDVSHVH